MGLREELEKLATRYQDLATSYPSCGPEDVADDLRALLAAHPEPATERLWPADAYPEHMAPPKPATGVTEQAVDVSPGAFMEIGPSTFMPTISDEMRQAAKHGIEGAAAQEKRFEDGAWVEGFAEDLANGALEACAPYMGVRPVAVVGEILEALDAEQGVGSHLPEYFDGLARAAQIVHKIGGTS